MCQPRAFAALAAVVLVACGGANSDVTAEPPTSDGGAGIVATASNPGTVSCGTEACAISANQVCCLGQDSNGQPQHGCKASPGLPCGGPVLQCDEPADCPDADAGICCLSAAGPGRCRNDCGGFARLCKSDSDCGDAGPCHDKICNGVPLRMCGESALCK